MSTGRLGAGDTAIQPTILDAKGDLIVATAADTPARLAVGSANQVLTVDSSTATGLKWATPATDTNGFVLIKTATFSGVADTGTTFDNVFSSTYTNYIATMQLAITSGAPNVYLQMRYAGPTTQAASYYSFNSQIAGVPTTQTLARTSNNAAQWTIASGGVGGTSEASSGQIRFYDPNNNGIKPVIYSELYGYGPDQWNTCAAILGVARTYTGFIMSYSSGNMIGTISVYGMAK